MLLPIIMLSVTANIYLVLTKIVGIGSFPSLTIAILLFFGWWKFNQYSNTKGLFKSNLLVYFKARKTGMSEHDSRMMMLKTRYPGRIKGLFDNHELTVAFTDILHFSESTSRSFKEPGAKVKGMVYAIFCSENGIPPTSNLRTKFAKQIEQAYREISRRTELHSEFR